MDLFRLNQKAISVFVSSSETKQLGSIEKETISEVERMGQMELKTFALIVCAHPYCARKFTCDVMHRARALSTKRKNDRGDSHCYSFF